MNQLKRITVSILVLGGLAAACAPETPVDRHWGESYRTLEAQQIADPDAGREVHVVEGMKSTTARDVSATYHSRQEEQPKTRDDRSLIELINGGE